MEKRMEAQEDGMLLNKSERSLLRVVLAHMVCVYDRTHNKGRRNRCEALYQRVLLFDETSKRRI